MTLNYGLDNLSLKWTSNHERMYLASIEGSPTGKTSFGKHDAGRIQGRPCDVEI